MKLLENSLMILKAEQAMTKASAPALNDMIVFLINAIRNEVSTNDEKGRWRNDEESTTRHRLTDKPSAASGVTF